MKTDRNSDLFKPPEWRGTPDEAGLIDLSGDGLPILPLEPELEDSLQNGLSSLDVVMEFLKEQNLIGEKILIFEPTEPDIRAAIVRAGSTYIDAGRYLDGLPDLEAASCALRSKIALTIFGSNDELPTDWPTPILVDRRDRPFTPTHFKENWSLHSLGTRDGLSQTKYTWMASRTTPITHQLPQECTTPDFSNRAEKRNEKQSQFLESLRLHGGKLGFEVSTQSGFCWISVPGTGADELRKACAQRGISVLGSTHHPYRNRVRIGIAADTAYDEVINCLTNISETMGLNR